MFLLDESRSIGERVVNKLRRYADEQNNTYVFIVVEPILTDWYSARVAIPLIDRRTDVLMDVTHVVSGELAFPLAGFQVGENATVPMIVSALTGILTNCVKANIGSLSESAKVVPYSDNVFVVAEYAAKAWLEQGCNNNPDVAQEWLEEDAASLLSDYRPDWYMLFGVSLTDSTGLYNLLDDMFILACKRIIWSE